MDRHKLLSWGLAAALGAAGCQHAKAPGGAASQAAPPTQLASTTTMKVAPDGTPIKPAPELPKRQPKPETCVAAANFYAQEAQAPNCPPLRCQELREQARRAFEQAIQIDPKHVPAYQGLARLYADTEDTAHAVETYQKGLKAVPKEAALWYELGMYQGRRKEWGPALESLARASELQPENHQYANALGYGLARAGRYDEALACFQRVNGEGRAHYKLARMLQHLGQTDLARRHLELALEKDPRLAEAQGLLRELDGQGVKPAGYSEGQPR
jgi:tetratricopeptide (TPR) repeat protein